MVAIQQVISKVSSFDRTTPPRTLSSSGVASRLLKQNGSALQIEGTTSMSAIPNRFAGNAFSVQAGLLSTTGDVTFFITCL